MIRHEPWFDRTHNAFLDWLVAGGILGFLGYLSLYVFAIWTLVKNAVFSMREKSVLIGLFSAYAFLSMFIFDNLTSYMLFILIIGLVDAKQEVAKSKSSNSEMVNTSFFTASIVLSAILILFLNLNAYKQNIILTKSFGQQKEGVSKNLELIETAISYSSVGRFESLEQMTRLAMSVLSSTSITSDDKNKFALSTIKNLDKYTKDFPQDVRGFILLGTFLSDVGLYDDAIPLLLKARDISPKKQQIYYSLAKAYFAKADKEKDQKYADQGVSTIKYAYDLAPEFDNPRLIYANVLIITGNIKEGIRIIKTMDDPSMFADKGMIDLVVSKGFKKDALEILELALKANPDKRDVIDSLVKGIK
jgi:tetratricopeptide (TPR) repeat protein